MRGNGWHQMREEIIRLQRVLAVYSEDPELAKDYDVVELRKNLAASRRTLESLWTRSTKEKQTLENLLGLFSKN